MVPVQTDTAMKTKDPLVTSCSESPVPGAPVRPPLGAVSLGRLSVNGRRRPIGIPIKQAASSGRCPLVVSEVHVLVHV